MWTPQQTGTAIVDRNLASAAVEISKVAGSIPTLGGRRIDGVAIGTSDTRVNHLLGYPASGYLVVKRSAGQTVFDGTTSSDPKSYFNLKATAAVVVSLVVF